MNPKRCFLGFTPALLMLAWTNFSIAYVSMPKEPIAHKMALADCVVLGKITAIQAKPVQGQVWRYSALPKWDFTVVEVEVLEPLFGPKNTKKVRFGFIGSLEKNGSYKPTPAVGQTGCFFGVQVGKNDFYVVPRFCYHEQNEPGFAKDLALARQAGSFMSQPDKGLKSKNTENRALAAHLVVLRSIFAPFRYGETGKAEPIDAELSKLTLLALADADWTTHDREVRESLRWLNWAGKHGAPPPKNFPPDKADDQWPAAAKQWLRNNAESYRIHRLVKAGKNK